METPEHVDTLFVFEKGSINTIIKDNHGTIYTGGKRDDENAADDVKTALQTIEGEGLIVSGKMWWAIYRFLSTFYGYPKEMTDFCMTIDKMNVTFAKPCIYNNWRRVGQETSLPQNLNLWHDYADKANDLDVCLIAIERRLREILL